MRFHLRVLTLPVVATMTLVACGSDGDDDAARADELRSLLTTEDTAFTTGDGELLRDVYTPARLTELTGSDDPAEQSAFLADEVPFSPAERQVSFELTSADDDQATARVVEVLGLVECERDVTFEFAEDRWWLDELGACVDDESKRGAQPLRIEMTEYAFVIDTSGAGAGEIDSLELVNAGAEPHMALVVGIPPDLDLEATLAAFADGPPDGVEPLFQLCCWDPGTTAYYELAEPLPAGRYAFIDPLPDGEGVPAAAKGMFADVSIG